ncbi:hypothetical protein V8E36_009941 [Tilletia maclaganii]
MIQSDPSTSSYTAQWAAARAMPSTLVPASSAAEIEFKRTLHDQHGMPQSTMFDGYTRSQSMTAPVPPDGPPTMLKYVPRSLPSLSFAEEAPENGEQLTGPSNGRYDPDRLSPASALNAESPSPWSILGAGERDWSADAAEQPRGTFFATDGQSPQGNDDEDESGFEPPSGLLPPIYMHSPAKSIDRAASALTYDIPARSRDDTPIHAATITAQLQSSALNTAAIASPGQARLSDRNVPRSFSFSSNRSLSFNFTSGIGGSGSGSASNASPYHPNVLKGSSVELTQNFPRAAAYAPASTSATGPQGSTRVRRSFSGLDAAGTSSTGTSFSPSTVSSITWPRAGIQADVTRFSRAWQQRTFTMKELAAAQH